MKKQRVLTEKAVNAKVVFRGAVIEIKKVDDQEVELTLPENVDTKELLGYLESFGVLKRKVLIPHLELQPEVKTEENTSAQQEAQEEDGIKNFEEEVRKEDSNEEKKADTEEPSQEEEDTTSTKRRTRKSKSN